MVFPNSANSYPLSHNFKLNLLTNLAWNIPYQVQPVLLRQNRLPQPQSSPVDVFYFSSVSNTLEVALLGNKPSEPKDREGETSNISCSAHNPLCSTGLLRFSIHKRLCLSCQNWLFLPEGLCRYYQIITIKQVLEYF